MKKSVMALLVVSSVAVGVGGCGGSDSCSTDTACSAGSKKHYHLCTGGADNCYYKTSDGTTYRCITCGDCSEAAAAATAWCAGMASGDLGVIGTNCGVSTQCPSGGGSYQACASATGTDCGFLTSDGLSFSCNSCSDCVAAAAQAANWCGGGGVLDMAGGGTGCDVVQQNCPSGQKCVAMYSDPQSNTLVGICTANGTVGADQACQLPADPSSFLDDCQGGLICDNDGPNAASVCRKICTADSQCPGGQRCSSTLNTTWGWCLPTCNPFSASSGCSAGNDCGASFDDISATDTAETGFFVCKKTGAGAAGANCNVDTDCGADLWCDGNSGLCEGNCNPPSQKCPSPGGTTPVCNPFSDQNGAGYCTAS